MIKSVGRIKVSGFILFKLLCIRQGTVSLIVSWFSLGGHKVFKNRAMAEQELYV